MRMYIMSCIYFCANIYKIYKIKNKKSRKLQLGESLLLKIPQSSLGRAIPLPLSISTHSRVYLVILAASFFYRRHFSSIANFYSPLPPVQERASNSDCKTWD